MAKLYTVIPKPYISCQHKIFPAHYLQPLLSFLLSFQHQFFCHTPWILCYYVVFWSLFSYTFVQRYNNAFPCWMYYQNTEYTIQTMREIYHTGAVTCISSSFLRWRLFVRRFSSLFLSASSFILRVNASLFSCVNFLMSSFSWSTSCWS